MKQFFLSLGIVFLFLFLPSYSFAQATPTPQWGDCVVDGVATLACIPVLFTNIIDAAFLLSGTVAMFFIVVAGIKYITSGGDAKQAEGARKTLTYAIIGLVVVLLSFFIINVISAVTGNECIKKFGFGC